jgi:hypothetical protein
MTRSMQEILGKEIQKERYVPGTRAGQSEQVRYVSIEGEKRPEDVFRSVTRRIDPPLVQNGGVVLERCLLTLPNGIVMYPLRYHGDLSGWQKQIEDGATDLGLISAQIDGESVLLSDGCRYALDECKIEFY